MNFCCVVGPYQQEGHNPISSFVYLEVKKLQMTLYDGIRKEQSLK